MSQKHSFDIVSRVNLQEVDNAVNQARRELANRYDFKGSGSQIEGGNDFFALIAPDNTRMDAIIDILETRLVRRKVPLKSVQFDPPEDAAGGMLKRSMKVVQGIDSDKGREINKFIKGLRMKKVQVGIQTDQVRVTSPSKNQLQEVIEELKEQDFGIALQYANYR